MWGSVRCLVENHEGFTAITGGLRYAERRTYVVLSDLYLLRHAYEARRVGPLG